jgi:hypothetical protein
MERDDSVVNDSLDEGVRDERSSSAHHLRGRKGKGKRDELSSPLHSSPNSRVSRARHLRRGPSKAVSKILTYSQMSREDQNEGKAEEESHGASRRQT